MAVHRMYHNVVELGGRRSGLSIGLVIVTNNDKFLQVLITFPYYVSEVCKNALVAYGGQARLHL